MSKVSKIGVTLSRALLPGVCAAILAGCAASDGQKVDGKEATATVNEALGVSPPAGGPVVYPRVRGMVIDGDAHIQQEWLRLGGAAVVGDAIGAPADLPQGKGRYRLFANGVIVWSEDHGSVLVPRVIFDYWIGLVAQGTTEDPTKTRYDYIGLPKKTSDTPPSKDTAPWETSVHFERGIIGTVGGVVFDVEGHIYDRYAQDPGLFGVPTGAPPHASLPNLQPGWIGQVFTNGEIWTRQDTDPMGKKLPVVARWLPFGPVFDYLINVSDCGDPEFDIEDLVGGGQRGRFSLGDVYSNASGQVLPMVPNSPGSPKRNRASVYADLGGPSGWLGEPIATAGLSAGGAAFSEFQNGLLVSYPDNTTQVFQQLTFHYDTARDTYGPDLGFGPYWSTSYDIYGNGIFVYHGHAQDGRHNFSSNHETRIGQSFALGPAHPTDVFTVHLWGTSSANHTIGSVSIEYNIDNAWGQKLNNKSANDHMEFSAGVANDYPFDRNDYKGELWWSFRNFDTHELPYHTYARTFEDVSESDTWLSWGNKLFYNFAYKHVAKGGNCFGMVLLGIDSQWDDSQRVQFGRSNWGEPIHQYFADNLGTTALPLDVGLHPDLAEDINVKHGYQLGDESIAWSIAHYLPSATSQVALAEAATSLATGGHPIFSITSDLLFGEAHAIGAYDIDVSLKHHCSIGNLVGCTVVKVLDPNVPTALQTDEDFVEFWQDPTGLYSQWLYTVPGVYPANRYRGSEFGGVPGPTSGRIVTMPYSLFDHPQQTPMYGLKQILDGSILHFMGSTGAVAQVTDEQGRTLFRQGLTAQPMRWDDLAAADSRIPEMSPIPVPNLDPGIKIFASKGLQSTLRYDLQLADDQPGGMPYETMFTSGLMTAHFVVPGTKGVPDQVTLHQIGEPEKSIAFRVPANGQAKLIGWTLTGADKTRPIGLSNLALSPGQEIVAHLENAGTELRLENKGPATTAVLVAGSGATDPVVVGTVTIPSGLSGQDCSWDLGGVACTPARLGISSIFGFETSDAWSAACHDLTLVSAPTTEGQFALQIGGSEYREIVSKRFATGALQGITSSLALDVYVPKNPTPGWWLGSLSLFADCPSAGIHHAFMGIADLTGQPLGEYSTMSFHLRDKVVRALQTSHADFSFSLGLNALTPGRPFIFDNMRFVDSSACCSLP